MRPVIDVAAAVGPFFLIALGAIWLTQEGWRQGDWPGDARTSVHFIEANDGGPLVEVRVENPLSSPVLMSASARPAVLAFGAGRSTRRRRINDVGGASVGVVEAGEQGCYRVPLPAPICARRVLVDVHLWQPAGRLRRHRHVLALRI